MTSKEYYSNYVADDSLSDLSYRLVENISAEKPVHVLDFGCGTGKHSKVLHDDGIQTICLDLSFMNVTKAKIKHNLPCVICADETYLRNIANCDVVFTCSVLDHIQEIDGIIAEFKRIANKAVFLAETNSFSSGHYFQHDYEYYDFEKLPFEWMSDRSTGDGGVYHIWKWTKQ